jgi:hypothetical protein
LGNVGAEWCVQARVTARRSWCWGVEFRGLWWGFYRREGENGGLGSSRRGRLDQGQNRGRRCLAGVRPGLAVAPAAPAAEESRRIEPS